MNAVMSKSQKLWCYLGINETRNIGLLLIYGAVKTWKERFTYQSPIAYAVHGTFVIINITNSIMAAVEWLEQHTLLILFWNTVNKQNFKTKKIEVPGDLEVIMERSIEVEIWVLHCRKCFGPKFKNYCHFNLAAYILSKTSTALNKCLLD